MAYLRRQQFESRLLAAMLIRDILNPLSGARQPAQTAPGGLRRASGPGSFEAMLHQAAREQGIDLRQNAIRD